MWASVNNFFNAKFLEKQIGQANQRIQIYVNALMMDSQFEQMHALKRIEDDVKELLGGGGAGGGGGGGAATAAPAASGGSGGSGGGGAEDIGSWLQRCCNGAASLGPHVAERLRQHGLVNVYALQGLLEGPEDPMAVLSGAGLGETDCAAVWFAMLALRGDGGGGGGGGGGDGGAAAAAPAQQPIRHGELPGGWACLVHQSTGRVFYRDAGSGATSWSFPGASVATGVHGSFQYWQLPGVWPLPQGWEARFDEGARRLFFINHAAQQTAWDHP
jgi:hypothetical protein